MRQKNCTNWPDPATLPSLTDHQRERTAVALSISGNRGVGKYALVSADDFEFLNQWKWHIDSCGYVRRAATRHSGYVVYMARVVAFRAKMNLDGLIDHVNGNTLDNTRGNLRSATRSQNGSNRKAGRNNKCGILGVFFHKRDRKFVACLRTHGKRIYLGNFDTAEEASQAYQEAAKKHHGEFIRSQE